MSLEIYPTYPQIRTEQLSAVAWNQLSALTTLISNTANSVVNDTNVASVINTGTNTQAAINSRISAQVTQPFLDPLVASLVNNETSQTRTNLNTIINNAIAASTALNYNGQVNGGAANWNTLTARGYYLIIASGTGGSNIPPVVAQNGILLVLITASGGLAQIFFGQNGAYAYRYYNGIAWGTWYGRSNTSTVYQPSTYVNVASTTYQTLYTFQPSSVLWAGSSGSIFVQVFGQLLYVPNLTSSGTYIRLRLSSSSSGLALIRTGNNTPASYLLTWAGSIITSDNLIVEARTPLYDVPPPQLVLTEESTQATQIYFIY